MSGLRRLILRFHIRSTSLLETLVQMSVIIMVVIGYKHVP